MRFENWLNREKVSDMEEEKRKQGQRERQSVMPASVVGSDKAEVKERKEHEKKVHKEFKELEHSLMKPTKGLKFKKMKRSVF